MTPVTPSSVCDMQGESFAALKAAVDALDRMGDMPDYDVSPYVWRALDCQNIVVKARAALAERTQQEALTDEQIDKIRFAIPTKAVTQRDHVLARAIEIAHGIIKDCGEYGHDAGVCGNAQCCPSAAAARPTSAADCTAPMQPSDVELDLMRSVYEQARKVLRFTGIDKPRAEMAWDELDRAIERVKEFDGGTMDALAAPTQAPMQPSDYAGEHDVCPLCIGSGSITYGPEYDADCKALAAPTQAAPAAQAAVGEATLPHDITVGGATFRKGVKLSTFVLAAQGWHREAHPKFYTLTDEQKADNLASLIAEPLTRCGQCGRRLCNCKSRDAAAPAAQSDLPPPDSAYWVNHDVTSPYTERAKPADTPYNLGWMSGWAAHGRAYPEQAAPAAQPIDMVLHCPKCGLQHIDALDERTPDWKNEPHRSHLCHGCGHIWRPADVPTNGVRAVKTRGKADSAAPAAAVEPVALVDRRIGLTVNWTNPMEASRLEHGTPLYAAPQPSVSQEAGEL